jgi:two-component sensor histidine kinase
VKSVTDTHRLQREESTVFQSIYALGGYGESHHQKWPRARISSLFNLQSQYITDPHALQMFIDSQNRVKSIALIHEILFRSRDLTKIDFAEYIKTISVQIFRSYGAFSKRIGLEVDVNDAILDVDTAIPCGLIVTELVSNSLKHAFVDVREGFIYIELSSDNTGMLTLIVRDNGIGLPKHIDLLHVDSLGLKLVGALVNQLAGAVEVDSSSGTTFKITFVHDKHKVRKDEYDTPSDHGC